MRLSFGSTNMHDLKVVEDNSFRNIIPKNLGKKFCVSWIRIYDTLYQKIMIISVGSENSSTLFGKIMYIVVSESKEIYFVYKVFSTILFSNHYHAY